MKKPKKKPSRDLFTTPNEPRRVDIDKPADYPGIGSKGSLTDVMIQYEKRVIHARHCKCDACLLDVGRRQRKWEEQHNADVARFGPAYEKGESALHWDIRMLRWEIAQLRKDLAET